ncbi:hypothetical protein K3N28_05975 [Glycomyces sp. TRM65418]|uniref:hypothetical protein n=1 Tax=Glycomyces sp. TRM65418 TaxID=2867006 RepID=UPI001CE4BB52|nr:hypothetical protein [Glycomyces sp. TRM65418]MCC3762617.1 hypothetical protein [Glycomyces sp. TRM65418]QZD56655.1 hypothetical protein K3N28_05935 [Glycomyces sp. TRM65418]
MNLVRLPVLGFAAVFVAATACTNTGDASDGPTDPTTPATAPTPAPEQIDDPEEAAIAAYTRYWDTVMAAFAAPDGDFSDFEAIASGQALEQAQAIEQRGLDEGVHGAGTLRHNITIKDSLLTDEVQQVVVTDCADSTDTQVLDAEGNPVAGEEYGYQEVQARMEFVDQRWMVTVMAVQDFGSCSPDP